MSWQDMGLYWAARGETTEPPPTSKRIDYARIDHGHGPMLLAVSVFDDGKQRPVNRDELAWHEAQGAKVVMP